MQNQSIHMLTSDDEPGLLLPGLDKDLLEQFYREKGVEDYSEEANQPS